MNKVRFLGAVALGLLGWGGSGLAQQSPPAGGAPAHLLVTVEPHNKGKEVPVVGREDVLVFEGHVRDRVIDWVPARGDHAALELFVVLDDGSNMSLGGQLDDIRKFIEAQPATTKIGVAYLQNGMARVDQELTGDHAHAAKTLHLPIGIRDANASPYISLSDLVKKWPASGARREVIMATDGVDPYYDSGDLQDPYLQKAIDDAVRAGIVVSAIYTPGVGHAGHSYWMTYWGQIYLAELAEKTGGEAYYIGFNGPPVAFAPYLDDVAQRLEHQYFLTFAPQIPKKAGWQQVRLRSEASDVDLISAGRVYVSPER
jgi:hypothetical protein